MTTSSQFRTSLHTAATLEVALDPIRDTQAIFRTALDALAWPGSVRQLPAAARGAPVNPWAAGLLITLLDHEVTLAVEAFPEAEALERFIRQRTNVAPVGLPDADFVLSHSATAASDLPLRLKRGSLAYPDDGATLVLIVASLGRAASPALRLLLAGPGVPEGLDLRVAGLSAELIEARNEAVTGYPCGIDLLLVDGDGRLVALPRSTEITLAMEAGR
jgi:alpha-D-ribose 1-methylphosphonate 5-triphosphate synthase subunit PhnH